jgi:hypothetical protein
MRGLLIPVSAVTSGDPQRQPLTNGAFTQPTPSADHHCCESESPSTEARWPSGLRRYVKEFLNNITIFRDLDSVVRKGVGSNPTLVNTFFFDPSTSFTHSFLCHICPVVWLSTRGKARLCVVQPYLVLSCRVTLLQVGILSVKVALYDSMSLGVDPETKWSSERASDI